MMLRPKDTQCQEAIAPMQIDNPAERATVPSLTGRKSMADDVQGGFTGTWESKVNIKIQQANVPQGGGFVTQVPEAEIEVEIEAPHTRISQGVTVSGVDCLEDAKAIGAILTMALVHDVGLATSNSRLPRSSVTLSAVNGEESASVRIKYFGTDFRGDGRDSHKEISLENLEAKSVEEARKEAVRLLGEMCAELTSKTRGEAQAAFASLSKHNVVLPNWARAVKILPQ